MPHPQCSRGWTSWSSRPREDGSIDLTDLDAKLEKHADTLAGIMITYPSTHGVFEEDVRTVCQKVHEAGGQVYVDGANLNALVGLALASSAATSRT